MTSRRRRARKGTGIDYVGNLDAMKAKRHHQNNEIGDQWRTPSWLFHAVNHLTGFRLALDLFTDGQNAKCPNYFTAEDNALEQSWAAALFDIEMEGEHGRPMAFANPPYSIAYDTDGTPVTGMGRIMEKAWAERNAGAPSIWVVKSAVAENWWPVVPPVLLGGPAEVDPTVPQADHIIHVRGRIGYEVPVWYRPAPGVKPPTAAAFGATILVFDKDSEWGIPRESYIEREYLRSIGEPLALQHLEQEKSWIESFISEEEL